MIRKHPIFLLSFLAAIVLLSRLPFLGNGFGLDPDAWRVANAARSIALIGMYSYSRPPGYPLQEILYSLVWNANAWLFNAITAIFSVVAFVFFALILKKIVCSWPNLGALALVFIPVMYINSVTSMDYVWALAFILGGFYFGGERRYLLAGIFLGLATGCRITSIGMVVPVGILIYYQAEAPLKPLLAFLSASILVGFAAFIPAMQAYGPGFLTFFEHGYPFSLTILKRVSIDVWGLPGSLALILAAILLAIKFKDIKRLLRARDPVFLASSVAILGYLLLFFRLPHEAGYLVPILPFVIIILCKVLSERWFAGICIVLALSSFILNLDNRQVSWRGPIFVDRQARIDYQSFTADVLSQARKAEKGSVILAGYYLPEIEWQNDKDPIENVTFVYLSTPDELDKFRQEGRRIYYLPGIDAFNTTIYGINPSAFGGRPLLSEPP